MAELLREYTSLVGGVDALAYVAQAWGDRTPDGRWEGWLVFVPVEQARVRRTERETVQPDFDALASWAGTLAPADLEIALTRSVPLRLGSAA